MRVRVRQVRPVAGMDLDVEARGPIHGYAGALRIGQRVVIYRAIVRVEPPTA